MIDSMHEDIIIAANNESEAIAILKEKIKDNINKYLKFIAWESDR